MGNDESGKINLFNSDDPSLKQADLKKAGFDTNVAQKVEEGTGINEGSVLNTIVDETTKVKDEKRILDELESMDQELIQGIPFQSKEEAEQPNKFAKTLFYIVLIISIVVVGYFYAVKKGISWLNIEPTGSLAEAQAELSDIRAKKIANNYFNTALALRYIGFQLSQLSVATGEIASNPNDLEASRNIDAIKVEISNTLKTMLSELSAADLEFTDNENARGEIILYLRDEQLKVEESLRAEKDKDKIAALEFKNGLLNDALKIMGDEGLLAVLKTINIDEQKNQEVINQVAKLLVVNLGDDYVSIGYKQAKRINWSQVIAEIEKVTQTVDENFSLDGSINENGVTYTSFSFNAEDSRINVAGQTRTSNERTFTLIADLTDAVENSSKFMNADTRTYSKQKDEADGFKSSIRLDFNLEE